MSKSEKKPVSTSKGGAPKCNSNALRHGRYSLQLGALERGCVGIVRQTNALRRQLESAVVTAKGEISLIDAATIHTIIRLERHAALATRYLRKNPDLPALDKLAISRDVHRASQDRDRGIKALLGADGKASIWDSIHSAKRIEAKGVK